MSSYTHGPNYTYKAGADLSGINNRFTAVKEGSGDNTCIAATANGDAVVGILQNRPALNQNADVIMTHGGSTTKVRIGAAVAKGAKLTPTTGGKLITATSGQAYHLVAMEAGAADNDIIQARFERGTVA